MQTIHKEIAASWLSRFSSSLTSQDARAAAECIQPDGFLRDVLVFTWRNRTLSGLDRITTYLADAFNRGCGVNLSDFTVDFEHPGLEPRVGPTAGTSFSEAVSAGFVFRTALGVGRGYFSLIPAEEPRGVWKAVNVFMTLWEINGYEEMGEEEGTYEGHTVPWKDVDAERRAEVEKDPHVLIIGAGQTGLNIGARFRQMQIPTLLIEKNPRVGDSWRQRYPTLTLHTPKNHVSMLYHPYPENWPTFTPRDKLANWLEQYAISQDLCIWTNTLAIPTPTYDPTSRRWTITVLREGTPITLHPSHIVLAASIIGTPRIPHFSGRPSFRGPILHSWEYRGGKPFAGQRVVVVGAGNSAADICQDLVVQGAREVTMVQRHSSCVVQANNIRAVVDRIWPPGGTLPISTLDFKYMATPFRLIKRVLSERKKELCEQEKELHDVLTRAGLELNMGEDGSGQFPMFFERYGGYWLEVGCAAFIESGQVKIKHGVEVASVEEQAVNFTDGSSLEADAIIFSTGYESIRDTMRELFGDEVIDKTGPVWGVDEEGEIRGCYHYSGQPGLWFTGGNFVTSRFYSKQLALQIKAIQLGLLKL